MSPWIQATTFLLCPLAPLVHSQKTFLTTGLPYSTSNIQMVVSTGYVTSTPQICDSDNTCRIFAIRSRNCLDSSWVMLTAAWPSTTCSQTTVRKSPPSRRRVIQINIYRFLVSRIYQSAIFRASAWSSAMQWPVPSTAAIQKPRPSISGVSTLTGATVALQESLGPIQTNFLTIPARVAFARRLFSRREWSTLTWMPWGELMLDIFLDAGMV